MPKRNYVSQNDFISDCEKIIKEKEDLKSAKDNTILKQQTDVTCVVKCAQELP